jgi:hypothetical protein
MFFNTGSGITICTIVISSVDRKAPCRRLGGAERSGNGNGRVYRANFTANDGQGGVCAGFVKVGVPKSMQPGNTAVDDGQLYNSTLP